MLHCAKERGCRTRHISGVAQLLKRPCLRQEPPRFVPGRHLRGTSASVRHIQARHEYISFHSDTVTRTQLASRVIETSAQSGAGAAVARSTPFKPGDCIVAIGLSSSDRRRSGNDRKNVIWYGGGSTVACGAVIRSVAVGEHASVGCREPVTPAVGCGRHAHDWFR